MKDKVLEIVKQKGPVLPIHVSKEINQNVLISSAILGELVSSGQIKFSHTKFGGSPLYYVGGQEPKLQQLYNQLHDTEKKIYDQLKKRKILRDKELEPAFRVALRQIKDFAVPLEIDINGNTEIFWKWYLSSNEEIKPLIKKIVEKEIAPMEKPKPLIKKIVEKPKEIKSIPKPFPETELREKLRRELLRELREELMKEMLIQKQPEIDKKEQKKIEREKKQKELDEKDLFLIKIRKYCQQKNIKVLNYWVIKRKNEIDLIINVPSAVGNIQYYCKAKNKKKINDNDLSSAFLKGNQKKLPILFLTTGDLIKKTQEKLDNEFRGISFKKINNN